MQEERVPLIRPEQARDSNDHIAERAIQLRFVSRVPMLCECSEPDCKTLFLIPLDRYHELRKQGYLTAPDHAVDGASSVERDDGYWLQRPNSR